MIKHFTIIFIVLSLTALSIDSLIAQIPNWLWAKSLNHPSDDLSYAITTDSAGNIYTTGYLFGATCKCICITKSDNAGNIVWTKSTEGMGGGEGTSIALDNSGNIYITGSFYGTADFDPGAGVNNLTSTGSADIFISKFDSSGNFKWAINMNGSGILNSSSIELDKFGNVYITGSFTDTVDFDPGVNTINLIADSLIKFDIFISKYDSSGNLVWAKSIGGTGDDLSTAIAVIDSGFIYITGYFSGLVDFDPGVDTFNLFSFSSYAFIFKADTACNFVWVKSINGPYSGGHAITLDSSGNIYTTGSFLGTNDFDPGTGTFNLSTGGGFNKGIYISKLDNSGNFVWAKAMVGSGENIGLGADTDDDGNIYTTGKFSSTIDFDPNSGTFNLSASAGLPNSDIYVSKLDRDGNFIWAKSAGGTNDDQGQGLVADDSGNVYITGFFRSPSVAFDITTLNNPDSTNGRYDLFVTKLGFGSWRTCNSIPLAGDYAAAFVTQGNAYVGTGRDSLGQYLSSIYKFDPAGLGSWSSRANYTSAARARASGFSLHGSGFIGLGFDGNSYNDFLEYFPSTDSWSTTAHALNWNNGGAPARYYSASFTIGNNAYVGLGTNGSSVYDDFYRFDGNTWTQIADFPGGARYAVVAFTIGDTAYVGTGMDANGIALSDFYAYDPVNGWHTTTISLGAGNERANAVAFSIGRFGFVALGGHGNGINCLNDLWQFDPSINVFTEKQSLPSTSLYNYAVGFSIGGKGYVCMGGSCDGTYPTNETWEYAPDNEVSASWIGMNEMNNNLIKSFIFPNPITEHATIWVRSNPVITNLKDIHLLIVNLLGQAVRVENKISKSPEENITINFQRGKLRPGSYIYKIMNGNEILCNGKFFIVD